MTLVGVSLTIVPQNMIVSPTSHLRSVSDSGGGSVLPAESLSVPNSTFLTLGPELEAPSPSWCRMKTDEITQESDSPSLVGAVDATWISTFEKFKREMSTPSGEVRAIWNAAGSRTLVSDV